MANLIGALATPTTLVDRQLKGTPTLSALVCKPVQSLWFELGTQSVVVANPLRPSLSSDTSTDNFKDFFPTDTYHYENCNRIYR